MFNRECRYPGVCSECTSPCPHDIGEADYKDEVGAEVAEILGSGDDEFVEPQDVAALPPGDEVEDEEP